MELIYNYDYGNRKDVDVLVRVYENLDKHARESEQCVGEVLFKKHLDIQHERFTSWLPRGCASAIVSILKKHQGLDVKVGIANEFTTTLGVLTSVAENFEGDLIRELREQELVFSVGL